ncbi:hypothetical protein HAX54_038278 [Datura stramonium]|uniref:DUF4283 domain-containing protein n=1 Tax=Datura stramonium TaxID=4076 RepID=A0ABS8VMY6_DATST|nr:hypothetical protein [Datura stramonium]
MSFMEALAWPALDRWKMSQEGVLEGTQLLAVRGAHCEEKKLFKFLLGWVLCDSLEAIKNWVAEEWGVAEGVKITQLNDTQFLFRFVREDQAVKILNEGRRWFDNNFMHLERWKENFARLVFGENLGEKRREGPCFDSGGRWGFGEDREGNIESGRRREGGFGGGRGRRVDLREPARMEVVGESTMAERKKSSEVNRVGRIDESFNYSNGSNHKDSNASTVQPEQSTSFLRPNIEHRRSSHPKASRRSDLGRRACNSHGSSLFAMGGQMEVSGVPPPPADWNCCFGEKKPAGIALCEGCLGWITAVGVFGSSGDLVLAGCGDAEAVEATPAPEMAPGMGLLCKNYSRLIALVEGPSSWVGEKFLKFGEVLGVDFEGKEERVLDLLRDIEKEANGIREKESDDPRERTKMSLGKAKEGEGKVVVYARRGRSKRRGTLGEKRGGGDSI